MKKRAIKIGPVLHLFVAQDAKELDSMGAAIRAQIVRALSRGEMVTENGVSQWYHTVQIRDASKTGADAYTWHKDGNRVRCKLYLCVNERGSGGVVNRTLLKRVWGAW